MKIAKPRHGFQALLISVLMLPLAGCANSDNLLWILHPNGPIARSSVYYLVVDVLLLLVVIVPATALVIWTFFRYRRGGKGRYDPTYNHSILVEAVVWGVPLLLVAILSYFSYLGARDVAPFNPKAVNTAVAQSGNHKKPLHIEVISTDWQWLFIYPDQGVAMSNRLVVPTGRKISMDLTSTTVTNDFYVLKVVNQIYMMPGMRTKQHFYLDRTGTYQGFSTEFSGPGFSWMNYKMLAVKPQKFHAWVQKARQSGNRMSWQDFEQFAQPTINTGNHWSMYSYVQPGLFSTLIHKVRSGDMKISWPAHLAENMTSPEFARRFGTGKSNTNPDGTTAAESHTPSDQ